MLSILKQMLVLGVVVLAGVMIYNMIINFQFRP